MTEPRPYKSPADSAGRWPRLRWWFLAGFVLAFCGMLLTSKYVYTGSTLIMMPMWRYYIVETQRALTASENLGPASGSNQVVQTFFAHVLMSAFAGAVVMGVGFVIRTVRRRRRKSP